MPRIGLADVGLTALLLVMPAVTASQSPSTVMTPSGSVPSPTTRAAPLDTAEGALAWLASIGFSQVDATEDAEGRSSWVTTLPMTGLGADVTVELVGTPDAISEVTLQTTLGSESPAGSAIAVVMQGFAPEHLPFIVNALLRGMFGEGTDATMEAPDGTIRVMMTRSHAEMPVDDTVAVSITIDRDIDAD